MHLYVPDMSESIWYKKVGHEIMCLKKSNYSFTENESFLNSSVYVELLLKIQAERTHAINNA